MARGNRSLADPGRVDSTAQADPLSASTCVEWPEQSAQTQQTTALALLRGRADVSALMVVVVVVMRWNRLRSSSTLLCRGSGPCPVALPGERCRKDEEHDVRRWEVNVGQLVTSKHRWGRQELGGWAASFCHIWKFDIALTSRRTVRCVQLGAGSLTYQPLLGARIWRALCERDGVVCRGDDAARGHRTTSTTLVEVACGRPKQNRATCVTVWQVIVCVFTWSAEQTCA